MVFIAVRRIGNLFEIFCIIYKSWGGNTTYDKGSYYISTRVLLKNLVTYDINFNCYVNGIHYISIRILSLKFMSIGIKL